MEVDGDVGGGTGSARRRRERRLRMHWRHEQLSLRMALASATLHSAQPRAKEVEGETNDAPRRPKPPLPGKRPAPLEEVAEPQAKLGQHSGIGYEVVLALDVPVLLRLCAGFPRGREGKGPGGGEHGAGPCTLPPVPGFARADAGGRSAEASAPPERS